MIPDIGLLSTELALLSAVAAVGLALYAYRAGRQTRALPLHWIESARRTALVTGLSLTLAVLCLAYALLTDDFSLKYVANVSYQAMSPLLKITALWAGQAGSLLVWSWFMAIFVGLLMIQRRKQDLDWLPPVIAVTMGTLAFFISMNLLAANPFQRFDVTPPDGQGLNPVLRHPGMIVHPPLLYLGFVGLIIPYAFAIAALLTGRTGAHWTHVIRRWTLAAWLCLSLGLLLGARWAYDVLGWGGYWGWDPVENAALMPWLTSTAFLHTIQIQQRRGLFKAWNMILIILTFSLVLFGTFITRSGFIDSVHTFARSPVGPAFLGFVVLNSLAAVALLIRRRQVLRSETVLDSLWSREAIFGLASLLFVTLACSVFVGTVSPVVSELLSGQKFVVGPAWFSRVTGPQFGLLVLLMGIAPLFRWRAGSAKRLWHGMRWPALITLGVAGALFAGGLRRPATFLPFALLALVSAITLGEYSRDVVARRRAQGETWPVAVWRLTTRNRRRYGGYLIHLGIVGIALGVLGTQLFHQRVQGAVALGETLHLGQFEIRYDGLSTRPGDGDVSIVEAELTLQRDGQSLQTLRPRRETYAAVDQTLTVPATRSTPSEDVYAILAGWEAGGRSATFQIHLNPLINWLWYGGVIFMIGTLIALWPNTTACPTREHKVRDGQTTLPSPSLPD